jgi:D-lyxose ketol-isomerase
MHTHVIKAEDIINRGGATLVVELYGSDDAGGFADDRGGAGSGATGSPGTTRPARS